MTKGNAKIAIASKGNPNQITTESHRLPTRASKKLKIFAADTIFALHRHRSSFRLTFSTICLNLAGNSVRLNPIILATPSITNRFVIELFHQLHFAVIWKMQPVNCNTIRDDFSESPAHPFSALVHQWLWARRRCSAL
jgi:hypothetical protein